MLPEFLSKENKRQMPYIGIIVTLVVSMFISISGSFVYLSQVSSVITFLLFIPTTLALVVFRYTKKRRKNI
ncbi:amino acid permease [Holzapfeliella floricola]|uniref:amino acid permease n=1 Tax=Holzapfeliella floricola TaxID=679249 RepID=UPI001A9215DB|nr:amino acid permease [Holzapfeliella floricola]